MSPELGVNTVTKDIPKHEPAGWFMNAENREAPADAAAPDMLSRQWEGDTRMSVCESNLECDK